ncbi:hypothetical protein JCM11251_004560 [Rhodosporidiobolus azoricus]
MLLRPALAAVLSIIPFARAATAAPLTVRRARTCVPQLEEGREYNVFQAGREASGADAQVWEFLPPAGNPEAVTGGAVYVSETNSPENGGFYIRDGGNGTYTLSLASQEEGAQCLRTVGKDRPLTSGPCDLEKAQVNRPPPQSHNQAALTRLTQMEPQFTLSCSSCSSTLPTNPGSFAARACVFTSIASPGYAIFSVPNGDSPDEPGLARVEVRKQAVRSARQSWDLVLS